MNGWSSGGGGVSLAQLQARGFVSVKDAPFNAVGDGVADDTALLTAAVAAHRNLVFPAGSYLLSETLVVPSNTTLRFEPGAVLVRGWASTVGDQYDAVIRNENAPTITEMVAESATGPGGYWTASTPDTNIHIHGCVIDVDDGEIGSGFYLVGLNNSSLTDCRVLEANEAWAYAIGGEELYLRGCTRESGTAVFEDGFHIYYGENIYADLPQIICGDDAVAIGSSYNLPIRNAHVNVGSFKASRGNLVKIVQERTGLTSGHDPVTERIDNVSVRSGSGSAGLLRNGLIHTVIEVDGLISDVSIDIGSVESGDVGSHDGTNPYGLHFRYIDNLRLRATVTKTLRGLQIEDCRNFDVEGIFAAPTIATTANTPAEIDNATGRLSGTFFCANDRGGVKLTDATVLLDSVAVLDLAGAQSALVLAGKVRGIGTIRTGRLSTSADARLLVSPSASDSRLVLSVMGELAGIASSVANVKELQLNAQIIDFYRFVTSGTVSVGTIFLSGVDDVELYLLPESGVSDSLSNITNGVDGVEITLWNGDPDPATNAITLNHGTSANNMSLSGATNYVLNTAAKSVTMTYSSGDGYWTETART